MPRRLTSLASMLFGFIVGSAASIAFAEAVKSAPAPLPAYDLPHDAVRSSALGG